MTQPTLGTYGGRLRDLGYPGQPADGNPTVDVSAIVAQDPAATVDVAIEFGTAVAYAPDAWTGGTRSEAHCAVADGTTPLRGVLLRHAIYTAAQDGSIAAKEGQSVGIRRLGYVYAVPTANVVAGQAATYNPADGKLGVGGTALGASRWESTTAAGEVGLLYVNV